MGAGVGLRVATVYTALAILVFYLQISSEGLTRIWHPNRLLAVEILGTGWLSLIAVPFLILIPISLAWLSGAVSGFLTALLAPLLGNASVARCWGMFCFFVPSLIFHNAAGLRPRIAIGEHWLNAYWFWIGLPTVLAVLAGGWVGQQLSQINQRYLYDS